MIKLNPFKAAAALILLASGSAFAQVNSGTGSDVALSATLQETLTVSLDQTAVTFALTAAGATNAGNVPVVATTSWVLGLGRTDLKLFAYFDDPTSALAQSTFKIASSQVSATVGGSTVGAFTSVVPFGTGVTIFDQAITDANRTGSKNSSVAFNIDLSSTPALPAGVYTGTLHFQAQATT